MSSATHNITTLLQRSAKGCDVAGLRHHRFVDQPSSVPIQTVDARSGDERSNLFAAAFSGASFAWFSSLAGRGLRVSCLRDLRPAFAGLVVLNRN